MDEDGWTPEASTNNKIAYSVFDPSHQSIEYSVYLISKRELGQPVQYDTQVSEHTAPFSVDVSCVGVGTC
jgi:hypothetical protein